MKWLLIIMFIISGMKSSCQNLVLSNKGFERLSIGDMLSQVKEFRFLTIDNYPDKKLIITGFEDYYNYYFLQGDPLLVANENKVEITHFFLATDKKGFIEGFTIFFDSAKAGIVADQLDIIYGAQKLQSESGANGATDRIKQYWNNNVNSVFLTRSIQKEIRLEIRRFNPHGFDPVINLNY